MPAARGPGARRDGDGPEWRARVRDLAGRGEGDPRRGVSSVSRFGGSAWEGRRERVRVRPTARRRSAAGRRVLVSDMSAIDAAWLRMDRPTNLAIITSVLWFARPPDWEAGSELLDRKSVV